jgi:tagatose 1,6-diphosphate aldolase GatY/KbaY
MTLLSSGIPEAQIKRCVSLDMAKMNIVTEISIVFSDAIMQVFAENPDKNDTRKYMATAKKAVNEAAIEKMRMLGCVGKAKSR